MPTPFSLVDAAIELKRLHATAPLVHCLTNDVVPEITANVLLALRCSPAMVVAHEEAGAFASVADALLVNVGTLDPYRAQSMQLAVNSANQHRKPWVLDPVAVGAIQYRTEFVRELIQQKPTAIRGNASEIMALAGINAQGKGPDSQDSSEHAIDAAISLARDYHTIVAVTGETDYITDGNSTYSITLGTPMLTRVVGTGCSLSATVAAFLAKASDPLKAVAAACAITALAGQEAEAISQGPGTFLPAFLDTLYHLETILEQS